MLPATAMVSNGSAIVAPASAASSSALLQAQGLDVQAAGAPLLTGVQLSLMAGEITTITGPSGCGKTTLLRTLAGLVDPAAGEIRLRGLRPADHGWPTWRRQVVYVAQRPVLLEGSALDNLSRPFAYRVGGGARFSTQVAWERSAALGLPDECLGREARKLSEGQQQRVCLLRALLVEPQVLLLDEPTSALDVDAQGLVERLVREQLARTGAAALVVTHDPTQALRFGDQHLKLDSAHVDSGARSELPSGRTEHAERLAGEGGPRRRAGGSDA